MTRTFKQVKRVAILMAMVIVGLVGSAAAGDVQKMVPPDVTLCVYIPDFSKLETSWKGTFLYKFTKDPQVENFILPLKKKIDAMSAGADAENQKALLNHFKGEMAFSISSLALKDGGPEPSFFIVAEHASEPAQVQASLKKFVESKGTVQSQTSADFMGVTIYTMKVSEAKAAQIPGASPSAPALSTAESEPFHFAILPKHLVLSSGEDKTIKQVIQLSKEPGETLFESQHFKSNFTGDYSGFPLISYVNIRAFTTAIDQALKAEKSISLAGLGLESLSSFGLAVNLMPNQVETWSVLSAPGPKTGVTKLFFPDERPNFDQALPMIPAEATSFGITSFSIPYFWNVIKQGVNVIAPQYGQMLAMQIQNINMTLQFDIEKDLIGSLGSELVQYSRPGGATAPVSGMGAGSLGSMGLDNSVLMLGLKDAAKFQSSIEKVLEYGKMMSGGQDMVEKMDFMGYAIYKVKTPAGMGGTPGAATTTPSPGFIVTPKYFAFSSDVEDVKQVARAVQGKGGKSVLDNAEFKALYEKSKSASMKSLGYSSSEAMKQWSAALNQMSMLAVMDPESELNNMFNFAAVPSAEVFQKYFGSQISTSNQQADKVIGHYVFKGAQ